MNRKYKLIVADIDGTLTNSAHQLSERTKAVIQRLHDNGYLFGIASGRAVYPMLISYAKKWGFDWQFDILIGFNGGELYDGINQTNESYYKLQPETIKEILTMLEPLNVNCFLYHNGVMKCMRSDEETIASSSRNSMGIQVCDSIDEMCTEPVEKLHTRVSEEFMPTLIDWVQKHKSDKYRSFKTQTTMYEYMDPRVNKALSLRKFCENNQIDLSEVMAFGDIENDNELLEAAGWGVCMINGSDETKSYANDVTKYSNDEDGLARYIEEHIFGD